MVSLFQKKENIVGFIVLFSFLSLKIIFLPKNPGNFYEPIHYLNILLPNFGLDSNISPSNTAFYTMMTNYLLYRILLDIINDNILLLHQILYTISFLFTFLGYLLFFSLFLEYREHRIFLSSILSVLIEWSSFALVLGMSTFFLINFSIFKKNNFGLIGWFLCFLSLALYWHSAHILFLLPILIYLLFLSIGFNKKINFIKVNKSIISYISIILILSIFIWFFIRNSSTFIKIIDFYYLFDTTIFIQGLLSKGSFIPLDYQYCYYFFIPIKIIDLLRYFTFFIACIFLLFFSIIKIMKNKYSSNELFTLSILLGGFIFILLYFLTTYSIGPAPIILFVIPYSLIICFNQNKIDNRYIKLIFKIIIILIILSLFLTALLINNININNSIEFSNNYYSYEKTSNWIKYYVNNNILSDANTIGYLLINYVKNKNNIDINIHFSSISLNSYKKLLEGHYLDNSFVVYNVQIYRKNLIFESLQSWNKFKPLSPDIINKNKLQNLYNNGDLLILSN